MKKRLQFSLTFHIITIPVSIFVRLVCWERFLVEVHLARVDVLAELKHCLGFVIFICHCLRYLDDLRVQ